MSDDARAKLAAEQSRLVAALSRKSDSPDGFDAARIDLAADTLVAKRRKSVARSWPRLAEALGERFAAEFNAYAAQTSPPSDGPVADGSQFARSLDARGAFPHEAAVELISVTLWRGRVIGCAIRRTPDQLLIGVRAPLLGVRLFSLPWRRPR